MQHELPAMAASSHSHAVYTPDALIAMGDSQMQHQMMQNLTSTRWLDAAFHERERWNQSLASGATPSLSQAISQAMSQEPIVTRRLVQVLIADTNENVPLQQCLLHRGEPQLTDLNDQELFFEIDIKSLLDKHNAERVKLIDKKIKERTEHLEPARIRDLKMVVVTIANL